MEFYHSWNKCWGDFDGILSLRNKSWGDSWWNCITHETKVEETLMELYHSLQRLRRLLMKYYHLETKVEDVLIHWFWSATRCLSAGDISHWESITNISCRKCKKCFSQLYVRFDFMVLRLICSIQADILIVGRKWSMFLLLSPDVNWGSCIVSPRDLSREISHYIGLDGQARIRGIFCVTEGWIGGLESVTGKSLLSLFHSLFGTVN